MLKSLVRIVGNTGAGQNTLIVRLVESETPESFGDPFLPSRMLGTDLYSF